jgi:Asp-tRNA(Asn)/Glu-tRNA(Gln) amidotransferase A subunit family amidase
VAISRREILQGAGLASVLALVPTLRAMQASASQATFDLNAAWDNADATTLAQWIARGDVTPVEALAETVARLEKVNPVLNVLAQNHIAMAQTFLESSTPAGTFGGVPFLLKDLGVSLAGTVTSAGSALQANEVASTDSEIVRRFKAAGLVVFGKTNTPEFGLALTTEGAHLGDCLNPWDIRHSTGGSSGGSAAAVAAGVLPMAHATDGGGSIRVPANHCGVFGLKPTRGLTPGTQGAGMSVGHVVCRSVRDSALMLELLAGYQSGAPYGAGLGKDSFLLQSQQDPRPLRVALNLTEPDVEIDTEVVRCIRETAALLETLGHTVEEAAPGIDYDLLNQVQNTLIASDMTAWLDYVQQARGRAISSEELEPMTHMIWREGAKFSGAEVAGSLQLMHRFGFQMAAFHRRYDVILQPVTATPAPLLGAITYRDGDDLLTYTRRFKAVSAFTHLYNMTGQPSMSVPLGESSRGLPIGSMFSAAVGQDGLLLSLAGQLERAKPWRSRRPAVYAGSV